jgi:hypothetical protein
MGLLNLPVFIGNEIFDRPLDRAKHTSEKIRVQCKAAGISKFAPSSVNRYRFFDRDRICAMECSEKGREAEPALADLASRGVS